MDNNTPFWKMFLAKFEVYAGALIFIFMTILLFIQVISRYFFHHSLTWTEELATILFVWMTYLGVAGAVTYRKHLKIDAFVSVVPFNVRRILLIISDIIFLVFALYIIFPMMRLVNNFADKDAVSSILKIPKAISYVIMPMAFVLTAIRLIQDIVRLTKEKEKAIGASKPTIDMEALEREHEERKAQREARS